MLFQYSPMEYWIERNADGELAVTICRATLASPKPRYNIHDYDGVITADAMAHMLADQGVALQTLASRRPALPFLWVGGRSDQTVAFYGPDAGESGLPRGGADASARAVRRSATFVQERALY